jgi:hypothetical protein
MIKLVFKYNEYFQFFFDLYEISYKLSHNIRYIG